MTDSALELSPSDLETMRRLTTEKNAEVLENKRLWEEKFPGSVPATALQAVATDYALKEYWFDFAAFFYVKVDAEVTYKTGEVRKFTGEGGGVGIGASKYWGGNDTTSFALSPADIQGVGCEFNFEAVTFGALIHFWTDRGAIGTLVGAGPPFAVGAFGGSGRWRA